MPRIIAAPATRAASAESNQSDGAEGHSCARASESGSAGEPVGLGVPGRASSSPSRSLRLAPGPASENLKPGVTVSPTFPVSPSPSRSFSVLTHVMKDLPTRMLLVYSRTGSLAVYCYIVCYIANAL